MYREWDLIIPVFGGVGGKGKGKKETVLTVRGFFFPGFSAPGGLNPVKKTPQNL